MRLGRSELYDPQSPNNSARIEAQIIYFQVAVEQDEAILERLKTDVYTTFGEAFTADERTGPLFAWNVVGSASFGWSLLESFENRLDEQSYAGELFRQRRSELIELRARLLNLHQTTALGRMGMWTLPLCLSILVDWKMDERLEKAHRDEREFGDEYRYQGGRSRFEPPIASPTFHFLGHTQYWEYLLGKSFYEYQHEDELQDESWVAPPHWEGVAAWKNPSCYPHGYLPEYETRRNAKKRIWRAFSRWLDAYFDASEAALLQKGRKSTKLKRARGGGDPLQHFEWLYCRQVKGWTYERVALHFGEDRGKSLSAPAVSEAVRDLAKLIGVIELRA